VGLSQYWYRHGERMYMVGEFYLLGCRWPPAFTLVSYSAQSSILKMEAIFSSERSVDFQMTTWRYIPEDKVLFITTAVRNSNLTEIFFSLMGIFTLPSTLSPVIYQNTLLRVKFVIDKIIS
jgi:hypothetical protein